MNHIIEFESDLTHDEIQAADLDLLTDTGELIKQKTVTIVEISEKGQVITTGELIALKIAREKEVKDLNRALRKWVRRCRALEHMFGNERHEDPFCGGGCSEGSDCAQCELHWLNTKQILKPGRRVSHESSNL